MKVLLPFLLFACITATAQIDDTEKQEEADNYFESENYSSAIPLYEELLRSDAADPNNNFRLGICWLRSNIDKSRAIEYFQKTMAAGNEEIVLHLLLGHSFAFNYQFDEAINQFTIYLSKAILSKDKKEAVLKKISNCENAKEMVKFPVSAQFENLGPKINSPYPDYFPFVTSTEDLLLFNSRRPASGTQLPNGLYPSEIYLSSVKGGEFSEAVAVRQKKGGLGNEDVIGLSSDGKVALLYFDNDSVSGDIYMANVRNGRLDSILALEDVNTDYVEAAASLSDDGLSIFFSSNRPGGQGGFDIYVLRKLPDGKWGKAENLGASINSDLDEDFPNIATDGSRLYFSSRGHLSMGGFDIFFSEALADGSWSAPRNVGYPINSVEDDMNFRIASNGKYGYISGLRKGGLGDIDIYRVNFTEVEGLYSAMMGSLSLADTSSSYSDVEIIAWQSGNEDSPYGVYKVNSLNGRYVMILPPAKYALEFMVKGSKVLDHNIEILGKSSFESEIQMDFKLGASAEGGR